MTAKKLGPAKAGRTKGDFSKAFKELEEIVDWFEDAEVDLEEGLTRFERGLELAAQCRKRLSEVENRVTKIKAKFSELSEEGEEDDDEEDEEEDEPQASLL